MKKLITIIAIIITALSVGSEVHAVPPNPVSSIYTYQGAIFVDDVPFNDTGLFKLAIVNQNGETVWSNDGSSAGGSEPVGDIAVAVEAGVFFILLGDDTIDGMTTIDPSIFATNDALYLKTWFSDGSGFAEMVPEIELTAASSAINSQFLRGYGPDDFFLNTSQITSSQIAPGAVTSTAISGGAVGTTQIATNSVTGDKIAAFSNNNTDFTVGRGVDENVQIIASTGAANEPGLRYDSVTDKWQFSNDGTTWNDVGSAGGSGTVNVGAINELAYYAAAGDAVSGLATANNGALVTSAAGVPSISSTLPSAVQDNITRLGTIASTATPIADAHIADALTISGGTVNNSVIGGTAPLAGTFRGLTDELDTIIQGGDLTIGVGTTAYAGRIVLHDADAGDSFTTTIQSNADVPASFSLVLPADDGNLNEVLTTDGSGNLSWSAVAGGDVTGPGSSTDNAVPRFDGGGGKTLQNSGVIVDDSNNITGVAALSIDSMGKDWTNVGRTIANLGTVTTANIDGGSIDGTQIGQGTATLGSFTDLVASTFLVGAINQGDILYDNGTSFVRLTPGTSGQFLQTQGAGANPVWAAGASGDVTGPGSSTDTGIARFSGATGKIIQNSGVTIDGSNNLTTPGDVTISGDDLFMNTNTAGHLLVADGVNFNPVAVSGDVAMAGTGAATVTDLTITGEAQGDVLYFNGTNWVRLPAGTSGQVLETQGAGSNPQWTTPGNTLDEAYDQGGAGAGRAITADSGPVEITGGTRAPMRLVPGNAPNSNLADGQIYYDTGTSLLYVYDGTRAKWLSVTRQFVGWGRNSNNTTNQYLRQFNGALSSQNGWRMLRNGTITGIAAQANANQNWTFEIRKNDAVAVITSLTMAAQAGNQDATIDIDFSAGDFIQAYCNGTSIDYPQGWIEIAWRPN